MDSCGGKVADLRVDLGEEIVAQAAVQTVQRTYGRLAAS